MSIDNGKFTNLCQRLLQIDFFGTAPPAPPWTTPSPTKVANAIKSGTDYVPHEYRQGYVDPLLAKLNAAIRSIGAEPLAAPIYEHAPGSPVNPHLNRFLAVISDLYRSFLSKAKRRAINVPLRAQLPPVAFFQNDGQGGPYTIPSDDTFKAFGSNIGIVSLPSTYRNDPLLWASLAHETGGHDVLHADPGLLEELAAGIRTLFGGGPIVAGRPLNDQQFQGLLWSFWIDETASDVYGLLNIGPEFAINLAAFFAALGGRDRVDHGLPQAPFPSLRTTSDINPERDPYLDEHPTDILRLHVAIGVVQNLTNLAAPIRDSYIVSLTQLASLCAQGATTIELTGVVRVANLAATVQLDRQSFPMALMQEAAQRVGGFIATATLSALDGHSVQDIETWDDGDESAARQIADALKANKSISELGDDAQLLAGATLALIEDPTLYAPVTSALSDALDSSFNHDPIWGPPARDHVISFARATPRKKTTRQKKVPQGTK